MNFLRKTQIHFLHIKNIIIKSYWKKKISKIILYFTKCCFKNLMQLNVILTCIWLKGLSKQVPFFIPFTLFLSENQAEKFDFVLIIKNLILSLKNIAIAYFLLKKL